MLGAAAIVAVWLIGKKKRLIDLLPSLLLIAFCTVNMKVDYLRGSPPLLGALHLGQPTYDVFALYADGSFGFQPSMWITKIVVNTLGWERLAQLGYPALPLRLGRASGARVRVSVVRSVRVAWPSRVSVVGPSRPAADRIENCVTRSPAGRIASS